MPENTYPAEGPIPGGVRGRILVIDDEADIRESLETLLTLERFSVETAPTATEGLKKLETTGYELVLLDLMMPDKSGMDVLEELRARDTETPVFLITAYGSIEVAVEALKRGASDYFSKPWDNEKLLIEIDRMILKARLERENVALKRALKERYGFSNIVGKSERMLRIFDLVAQVAPSRATVLVTGETGTGKELIARALHMASSRAKLPLVTVNAAALPENLVEAELFGHVRGAFTGAIQKRVGRFEQAHRSTLFFDEIGDNLCAHTFELIAPAVFALIEHGVPLHDPAEVACPRCAKRYIGAATRGFRHQAFSHLQRVDEIVLLRRRQLREHGCNVAVAARLERREGLAAVLGERQKALPRIGR